MILTLLTLNHGNQPPNKFLIALPFPCILIIHSLPCICSWLWIFLFQQHLVLFQEAHLNDCIFNFFFPAVVCYTFTCWCFSVASPASSLLEHEVPRFTTHISSTFRALYIFLLSWAASCWSRGFQLVTMCTTSTFSKQFFKVVFWHFQMHACMLKKKKATQKGYLIVSTQFLTNQGCCLQHI